MNSLRTRILLFFTLFAAVAVAAVYMGGRSVGAIGGAANEIVDGHLPLVHALGEVGVALQRQDNAVYRYLTTGDRRWLDELEKERANFNRWVVKTASLIDTEVEEDRLREMDEIYLQYDDLARQTVLTPDRASTDVIHMLAQSRLRVDEIQKLLNEMDGIRQGMTLIHRRQIKDTLERHKTAALALLIVIGAFFALLGFYLVHFLVRPLALLQNGIRNFTRGKTDVQIPPIGKDELGELQEAFNEMSREIDLERKRLRAESQSDSLTALFNMRYFKLQLVDEFSRSQRYGRSLSVLMIDVDNFKAYNDKNGHPAGDIVLKEIARILNRNVRGTDLVARYGGEEFVILLPETAVEPAAGVAEKIRRAAEDHHFPFTDEVVSGKITVSIGVATYPDMNITSDQDLVEASDKALYAAKQAGRNQVWFFSKGSPRAATELSFKPVTPTFV